MLPDDDLDSDVGQLDVAAMEAVRSAFTGLDGLIEGVGFQTLSDPEVLHAYFSDGIGEATDCRFDIRWYRTGYYSVHHTDSIDRDFRWDHTRKPACRTGISTLHRTRRRTTPNCGVSRARSRLSSPGRCSNSGVGPTIPGLRAG